MHNEKKLIPAWQKGLYIVTVLMLVVSGFGQMPLFKRYYVADLPGLGWTADFMVTHKLHYAAAAVFLALAAYWTVEFFSKWRASHRLTGLGAVKVAIFAGIALTGLVRTPGNLPVWHWDPTLTMILDVGHMALVMALGGAAAISALTSTGYLETLDAADERRRTREREKRRIEMENKVRARGAKAGSGCAPSG
jgi:hypothetical protein